MDVTNLPRYFNKGNIGSPYLLNPSKLLSPDVNKFFGTGAIDSMFNRLLGKVFPNLPMNPAFIRQHGVQDAMQLGEMFNNGKMHVNLGNLERGKPVVTNSAMWGMDDWSNPGKLKNISNTIHEASKPHFDMLEEAYRPVLKVSSEKPDFIAIYKEKKAENVQKKPKKRRSREKNEKSDDKNKKNSLALPAAGALAGAALPGAALAQYNLQDKKRIEKILKKIPIYTLNKMQKMVRPGDVGATGYINYSKKYPLDGDWAPFLHNWSRKTTGAPTGHGFGVGKYKKLHHSGSNHEWHPKGQAGLSTRMGNLIDSVLSLKETPKRDINKPLLTRLRNKVRRAVTSYQVSEENREKVLKTLEKYKTKRDTRPLLKNMESFKSDMTDWTDKPTYAAVFRPNTVDKGKINRGVNSMVRSSALPYGISAAGGGALKRLFLPKFRGTSTVGCTDSMCGDSIGAMHRQTGGGYSGRSMPVDVYLNREYSPLGVTANRRIKKDVLRRVMMNSFHDASRSRNNLGLLAMGLMSGAGAAAGYGVDKSIEKVKNIFDSGVKQENLS